MQNHARIYQIACTEIVAEGADLRVSVLTLDTGQYVPWHYHIEIADSCPRRLMGRYPAARRKPARPSRAISPGSSVSQCR
jgi:hypothetical protein